MRGVLSIILFGLIATALHAGVFYWMAPDGGAQAGGDQGADSVSLQGAAPQMQAMADRWQQQPDIAQTMTAVAARPVQPVQQTPMVAQPTQPTTPVALPSLPDLVEVTPMQDPVVETTPVAPPPVPKTVPKPKPVTPKPEVTKPAPKPAPAKPKVAQPKPAQAPAPKKQASGSGAAKTTSSGGTVAAQSLSKAQTASLQARWNAQIQRKIRRNMRYPRGTKATGTAKVVLTLGRDGRLKGLSLSRSSGNAALDQAAIKAVQRAGRFAKAPKGLNKAQYRFQIPLTFSK
jgi:protein TonB